MQRLPLLVTAILLTCAGYAQSQSRNLDIYWIDVEGGASTLIVAPSGESLLYDAGYGPPNAVDDRDAKRIVAAAQQAGLTKIDYFVLSHYHADHVGGLPALAQMIPIDDGSSITATRWKTWIARGWSSIRRSPAASARSSSRVIRFR